MRVLRVPLDVANVAPGKRITITGNLLWAVNASSPSANARIRFNHPDGDGLPVTEGFAMRTPNFQEIWIENAAQPGEFLELVYFISYFDFFVVNPGSVTSTVTLAKANNGANARFALVAGVNTTVLAADATRRLFVLKNEGPHPCRVGWDAATVVSDTVGILLNVGESIALEGTDAVIARNLTGAPADTIINLVTVLD